MVFALSFHSVIEGLALSLEDDASGVWLNFGALCMHKFVIAFAVGVELIAVQASRINYVISMLVFSLAPALGIMVGMIITRDNGGKGGDSIDDFAIQILQGLNDFSCKIKHMPKMFKVTYVVKFPYWCYMLQL